MQDFSFQGKVYLGTRLAGGLPGPLRDVGDAPKCDVSLATESEERKESRTGQRLVSARLQTGKSATVALTLNWANADNLSLGLYGTKLAVASGAVTDEALPDDLAVGDLVALKYGGISAVTVNDSAGTPAPLTAGTHYRIDSANGGVLEILNLGSFTQPFTVDYTHTASADVAMFTATPPERYLFLDGINTVDNSPVRVHLYRVKLDPMATLPLINEGFGSIEMTGSVLYDDEAAEDASLGGFGKIQQPTAVA
jgi:hypothetical protein